MFADTTTLYGPFTHKLRSALLRSATNKYQVSLIDPLGHDLGPVPPPVEPQFIAQIVKLCLQHDFVAQI